MQIRMSDMYQFVIHPFTLHFADLREQNYGLYLSALDIIEEP